MSDADLEDFFEKKAKAGDGMFAIALGLMKISAEQHSIARALDRLGMNDMDESPHTPGTTEKIAMELRDLAEVIAMSSN